MILAAVFIAMLLIIFGAAALVMRPTREQKDVQRRIVSLTSLVGETGTLSASSLSSLTIREPEKSGWFDQLLGRSNFAAYTRRLILQSQRPTSIERIVTYMSGLAFLGFVVTYYETTMFFIALGVAVIVSYLPIALLRWTIYRRLNAFNTALPDCIETCARSLRAGHSIVAAINIIAEEALEPAKTEFSEVFKKQNYGLPLRDALLEMLERMPSTDLQVMVTGILVQKDTGGNLAEILDRTSAVIRDRIRIQGDIRIHTAQGRLTGWILFLLPVFMMFTINLVNPGYSHILFHDEFGQKLLYAGLAMLFAGGFFIRRIVNGIEV
jgi:tight adherence protein B